MDRKKKVVYASTINENLLPYDFNTLPSDFQALFNPHEKSPAVYYQAISNCLVSPFGVVFKNGILVKESLFYMSPWWKNILTFYKKIGLGKIKRIKGPCLVAINPFYSNYGHWLIESMPRIFAALDMHPSLTMLVPADAPRFIMEFLQQFHFKEIYSIPVDELVSTDEVVLPNSFQFGLYNHVLMRDMKSYLIKSIAKSTDTSLKKYLLSRDKAAYRKSPDEIILAEHLKDLGFEKLFAEDLSVKEQISTFSQANYLVGIHSTGLNNSLFMPDKSTVIDFIIDEHHDISPYSISQVSHHRFAYLLCKRTYHDPRKNYDDPILDLTRIKDLIKDLN